jgi:peptidoglycan/xylan/chitin deacetylase (PgdA/CDA1 family)
MKNIRLNWPAGRPGALMSTWDDGTEYDRTLVGIFNRHGLKGSFFLNSGALGKTARESGWKNYVGPGELATLYARHEVGSHTVSHPHPWQLSAESLRWEFTEDRRRLETLVGYPIRGAVIPFGWESGTLHMAGVFAALGFRYARHTESTERFELPAEFLQWRPTAHCGTDLDALWTRFESELERTPGSLLNLWGHSYEFEDARRWDQLESFAARAGARGDVWHATAGEVYDYLNAWRNLAWSVDGQMVYNPAAVTVCFSCEREPIELAPGETRRLG